MMNFFCGVPQVVIKFKPASLGDVSQDWQGLSRQTEGRFQGGKQAQERRLESRSEGPSCPHPAT